jgi:hypothetical protein
LFDSSIAMMPLPGATIAWAMLSSCSILMDERLQKNSALRRHKECRPE